MSANPHIEGMKQRAQLPYYHHLSWSSVHQIRRNDFNEKYSSALPSRSGRKHYLFPRVAIRPLHEDACTEF